MASIDDSQRQALIDRDSCCGGSSRNAPKPAVPTAAEVRDCCGAPTAELQKRRRVDWMLWGSAAFVIAGYLGYLVNGSSGSHSALQHFSHGVFEMMNTMWWGILLGILFVGLLDRVPREVVFTALGGTGRLGGIMRATAAGLLFDLCNHGILMIGMKLYERGASIGQTAAFLLASPWNSLSMTVILIALVGWKLALLFILLSGVIAIITGYIFDTLVERGRLPDNPARLAVSDSNLNLKAELRTWLRGVQPSWQGTIDMLWDGLKGSRMVLRWLLFGVVLAATIRAVMPADVFADWFGPTLLGVLLTVIAATIIEVCSEGSAPIAADLVSRAGAPGNGFTFLMAGAATDYTEIMSLKDTTGSWKLALMLPVLAVPQTLFIAVLLNAFAT
ncbi:MAG: permease [Pseudomonadota bacterium]